MVKRDSRVRAAATQRLDKHTADERAAILKERIYVTFVGLAILLALGTHADSLHVQDAVASLLIGVVGLVLAGLVSDIISHLAAHDRLPNRGELLHMLTVSARALGVVVVPLAIFGLVALDLISIETALRAAALVLILTLSFVAYLAVRGSSLSRWKKALVLMAEVVLGVAVVAVELLAHA